MKKTTDIHMENLLKTVDRYNKLKELTGDVLTELANAGLMSKFPELFIRYFKILNEGK